MTVIELKAQLLRELSYISDNEGYQKTLDFIKKLTKSNVASNVRGQIYTEMLERLSDFQEYEKGWDGDDALPLSRQVVKNFKAVLQKSRDSELEGWTFFPSANGTLLLQNKERKSGNTVPGTVGSESQRTFHTPCVPDLHSLGKKFSFFLLIQKNSLTFAI